jgi:hypothetical protein
MLKKLWEEFKNWNEVRKINKWYNWELLDYEWQVVHESPRHRYEVRKSKFINIHTGEIKYNNPYYDRRSRFRNRKDYRVRLKPQNTH